MLDSPATVWTDLPEYVFESVVEQLQGDRKVSADFRRVCHAWLEAHDRLVTVLRPNGVPQDARLWSKFGGVKTLSFKLSSMQSADGVNDDATLKKALEQLTNLTSLDLTRWKRVTNEGITALAKLTGLVSLDLTHCPGITNEGVKALSPLTALTRLNLCSCFQLSDEGIRALASFTAMTDLKLSNCHGVSDDGVRALAPLTAMTSLDLSYCDKVTSGGVSALAPLTALTHLKWSGSSTLARR